MCTAGEEETTSDTGDSVPSRKVDGTHQAAEDVAHETDDAESDEVVSRARSARAEPRACRGSQFPCFRIAGATLLFAAGVTADGGRRKRSKRWAVGQPQGGVVAASHRQDLFCAYVCSLLVALEVLATVSSAPTVTMPPAASSVATAATPVAVPTAITAPATEAAEAKTASAVGIAIVSSAAPSGMIVDSTAISVPVAEAESLV